MAYFGRRSDQKYSGRKRKPYNKDTGGLQTGGAVANRMSQGKDNLQDYEFYEIELAEVMFVYDNPEKLPKYEDGTKSWELMGSIKARPVNSQKNLPLLLFNLFVFFFTTVCLILKLTVNSL